MEDTRALIGAFLQGGPSSMSRRAPFFIVTALAAGCGGSTPEPVTPVTVTEPPAPEPAAQTEPPPPQPEQPPAPPPPAIARLRVMHVAALSAERRLDAFVGPVTEQSQPTHAGLEFGGIGPYREVSIGTAEAPGPLSVTVRAEGATPASVELRPTPNQAISAFAITDGSNRGALAIVSAHDASEAPAAEAIRARFLQVTYGRGPVDVCFLPTGERGSSPLFTNIAYGAFNGSGGDSHYVEVTFPGAGQLLIKEQNVRPCHGRTVGTVNLTAEDVEAMRGRNITFIAIGRASGRPPVPRDLVICEDHPAPSNCRALPARPR
ncbi:MAG: DUF4397 domain-containing protein [Myxococcota bacterium]|nr:DUF4397 domain-containing protein [Myxococcota bacterium]